LKKNIQVGCAIILAFIYTNSIAQQIQNDTITAKEKLEDVSVTYNKWEQKLNEIPNRIVKLSLKNIRLQNPQTMADVLGLSGEVFIQKSQLGGGSPMIRGFATNRVLIVVDGVRMNNAIYRSGNIQNVISLDPLAVEDAEVIFGPGSLIYGSDAIGGVMDFHTLQPKFATAKKQLVTGNTLLRYSSANKEKTAHFDFNIANDKLSFLTSFSYSNFSDLQMGKHGGNESYLRKEYVERINNSDVIVANASQRIQKFSGYAQKNLLAKIAYQPTKYWLLQYGFHYSTTSNIPRYDRLIEYANNALRFAEWNYGPQTWLMHNVQLQHNKANQFYNNAKLTIGYQDYEESRMDRRRNNNTRRTQTEQVKALSINIDFDKKLNEQQSLFYGLEYIDNGVTSVANNQNINTNAISATATRYPTNSTWKSYAAYISYKNNLSTKTTISTGLRYNAVSLHAPFDTSFFKFPFTEANLQTGAITGNLGFVYKPNEQWQINAIVSTGFRMPNIDDVGKVFESAPGIVVVPNTNLKSEYAINYELGFIKHKVGKHQFYASIFYTVLNNALTRRPFTFNGQDSILFDGTRSQVEAIQNVATAKVWGVQTGFEINMTKKVSWQTKLNFMEGKETDDVQNLQVPLRHAPPFFGSSTIDYTNNGIQFQLNFIYNSEISNSNLAPSEAAKIFIYAKDVNGKPYSPAWHTLNAKASYKFNCIKTIVSLGCENITNQLYRPYSSGIVAAGINFIFSIKTGL
jgi:hemoglobin/transferrin/lactoferrin receptor protein